jgi:hypothetical protein
MAGNSLRIDYETLRSLAFGSISGTYAAIGAVFASRALVVKIYNGTDVDLLISTDGSTDHDIIPSSASFTIDVNANQLSEEGLFFPKGSRFYVKQASGAASSGSVYLTVLGIA